MTQQQKLSIAEKAGYGLGDCAANFIFQTQLIFMMSFYTDVFGIAASAVGWMFLLSRLLDAVNDLLMGALADRTKTRWGKFRPWILWTALPLTVCFVLTYTTPDLSPRGKLIWACVTYNLLMLAYTANNIPYSALTGVLTNNSDERASLVTWRLVFALIGSFMVQTFTLDLVNYFGGTNKAHGYTLTVSLWAVIAIVFFIVTFLATKERVQPDPKQESTFIEDIADLKSNRAWISLALLGLFVYIFLSMRGGTLIYYFRYYLQREDLFGSFNAWGMATSISGILLSKSVVRRVGKKNTFRIGLSVSTLATVAYYFVPATSIALVFALQIAWNLSYGITVPLLWAMMADVADYSEWKTGRRATAMTFAATVFALKIGSSIGGALSGWLLDQYGYIPNQPQTQESLQGILLIVSLLPAIAFIAGLITLNYYAIDKSVEQRMQQELAERRETTGEVLNRGHQDPLT